MDYEYTLVKSTSFFIVKHFNRKQQIPFSFSALQLSIGVKFYSFFYINDLFFPFQCITRKSRDINSNLKFSLGIG